MHSKPLVSIILPTWNRALLLPRALNSIKAQSFCDYEIVVIDDGSEDNTRQVISTHDAPVRYYYQANGGVASARNLGVEKATGQWVAFLDSDDSWMCEKLLLQMQALAQNPDVSMVFSDYEVWDESLSPPEMVQIRCYPGKDTSYSALTRHNFVGTLTVVVQRQSIEAIGGFDVGLKRGSDYDAWLRIARKQRIMRVPGVLARYRRHQNSLTGLDTHQDARTRGDVLGRLNHSSSGFNVS